MIIDDTRYTYVSLEVLARVFSLPRNYLTVLAKAGKIPSLIVKGQLRFNPDAVQSALGKMATEEVGDGAG